MKVGVLALQGSIEPHVKHLKNVGAEVQLVRLPADMQSISGLILPGGESTTMIKLAKQFGLWDLLRSRAKEISYWGTCAGAILMAREVQDPAQESLHAMDIVVARNAYGRQLDSFQQTIEGAGIDAQAVFIRAPKFVSWGSEVKVEGKVRDEAVYLSEGRHMVTAFHPELTDSSWCHKRFLDSIPR